MTWPCMGVHELSMQDFGEWQGSHSLHILEGLSLLSELRFRTTRLVS